MPLLALKAHYDGHSVVFNEPCDLLPETPLLVVVNPQATSIKHTSETSRANIFQEFFGSLRGKLSTTDEFIARKAEEKTIEGMLS